MEEGNLTEIQKQEVHRNQNMKGNYETPKSNSSVKIVSKRIMKICKECDVVFEKQINHRHQGMKYIIMRCMQCNHCKKYFNIVSCTCKAILSGTATLPEYESHHRHTVRCETCNRYLIFRKEDFSKHTWEVYEQHRADVKIY